MAENDRTLTVTQEVKELIFDIKNKSYLTGLADDSKDGQNYERASNIQVSDDEDSSYQIRRSLSTAFSTLKSVLAEYLKEDKTTGDNKILAEVDNDGQLVLEFYLPSNYNNASFDGLANEIHSYLVDAVLAEWFAITDKEEAQTYSAYSATSLQNIKYALYQRIRPTRPKYD